MCLLALKSWAMSKTTFPVKKSLCIVCEERTSIFSLEYKKLSTQFLSQLLYNFLLDIWIFGFLIEIYVQRLMVLLSKKSFGKKTGQMKECNWVLGTEGFQLLYRNKVNEKFIWPSEPFYNHSECITGWRAEKGSRDRGIKRHVQGSGRCFLFCFTAVSSSCFLWSSPGFFGHGSWALAVSLWQPSA